MVVIRTESFKRRKGKFKRCLWGRKHSCTDKVSTLLSILFSPATTTTNVDDPIKHRRSVIDRRQDRLQTDTQQQLSSSAAQQQLHPKFPRIPSLPEHPRCDHDDDDGDSGGIAKNNSIDENIFQIKQSLIGVDDLFRRYFDSSIPISVSTIGI